MLVPDLGAVALRFPFDVHVPQLKDMLQPDIAIEKLAPWMENGSPRELQLQTELVRYKPLRRCVVEYRTRARSGEMQTLFAKAQRRKNAHASRCHYAAFHNRSRGSVGFSIAQPAGWLEEWHALVFRRSTGRLLTEVLLEPGGESASAAAGRALAAFHDSEVSLPNTHGTQRELETLQMWVDLTSAAFPVAADLLFSATRALGETRILEREEALRPAHRDFHDQQIVVDGDRVAFLDLDTVCYAERELDAGNYLAHLRLLENEIAGESVADKRDAFLRGYNARERRLDSRRLAWYEASASVRLACVYAFRPGWRSMCVELVRDAYVLLDSCTTKQSLQC